ncbi:TolC family protein [Flavobacterium sp. SM2513]|uniref:TolC family protein n=1 Tax=Flavobacterium sp. SM2513 TaxID=3424766 RepID=UPI003D7F6089
MQIKLFSTGRVFLFFSLFMTSLVFSQQLDPELKKLINKGLEKSHSVQIKNFEAAQARIDQTKAKSVFLPKVTFNGSYTRLDDDITFDDNTQNLLLATQKLLIKEATGIPFNSAFPDGIPLEAVPNLQNKDILKSSVDVDWVLFSGLEASNAFKASKSKEASLNYLALAEKDKIALNIIETYDKLALVYASKKVLTTSENYLKEQEFYVKKAIENGLATPISRKKIELAQLQLAGKLLEFNQNKKLLIEVLHQLTNENKETLKLLEPNLQPFAVEGAAQSEKRNEIKALEEAEKATLFKSKMEKSNFIPKLALKGHYEFLENDLSLFDPRWYVGVGIKWNVFDANESRLKSQQSLIEGQKYRQQLEEADEMIALSVVKAQLAYEAALQNTEMIQKEIELAEETYQMVDKQYRNALTSIKEVLDALNEVEKAHFKLQQSYFEQRRAVVNLLFAKGVLTY